MTVKAIFFDLDGVLVDAVDLHRQAFSQAVQEVAGVEITKEEHNFQFDGLPTRVKLEQLARSGRVPWDLLHVVNRRKQELTQVLAQGIIRPDPVKLEMVCALKERYPLAVVSNCIADTVKILLGLARLYEYFGFTVSNEDVKLSKPSPDPYLFALKKVKLPCMDTLAIEDNPRGVRAALSAGVPVLRVEYPDLNLSWLNERILKLDRGASC